MATKQQEMTQINQIQRDVGEIKVSIARVEENIKAGTARDGESDKKFQSIDEKHKEFNERLTQLERWQWKAIGIGATVFTVISVVVQYLLR